MSKFPDEKLHHTLFLFRKIPLSKIIIPSQFLHQWVADEVGILDALKRDWSQLSRVVVVVEEMDFIPTLNLFREKSLGNGIFHYGFLVVAKDPSKFLKERGNFSEFLDVASFGEMNSSIELVLLRSIRQLTRLQELGKPRLGQQTLQKLNEIFIALSAERDPRQLLAAILWRAVELTAAQSGRLYMIEEQDGEFYFRLRVCRETTDEVSFQQTFDRVTESSICGYVALTGKAVNIADITELKPYTLPSFNKELDHNVGQTKTLLTVPMKNRRNETIAVLQLVNKRSEGESSEVAPVPFAQDDEGLLSSFGTQAAICLENVDLYGDIQRLFDGFVKASITAIESRDPSTGGHSERVAKMSVALARATTECEVGIYRSVRFKEEEIQELNYAALLHDFGKIGVREEVLVKAKKLYSYQLESIAERIKACKVGARMFYLERILREGGKKKIQDFDKDYENRLKELSNYWEIIMAANEPSVLRRDCRESLEKIRDEKLALPDGTTVSLLTDPEFNALAVAQGSLTESERLEVESHVRHTYQFLKMIPWTRDFRHLTEIAYAHHEKLDGSGYPRNLTSHEIPLQSKIMTIVDIYDALTAADRWYKNAVSTERAIEILADEVTSGKLDPVLFELFVEKKIYELNRRDSLIKVA